MIDARIGAAQIAGGPTSSQVNGPRARPGAVSHRWPDPRVHSYCAPMTPQPAPRADDRQDRSDRVRVLAHPLRSRLLAELRLHGEATASDLARALGTHTGATSYHLRRLADVGLVLAGEPGPGRRLPWRAAAGGTGTTALAREPGPGEEDAADPDDAAALDWLSRDYLAHFAQRADSWLDDQGAWPPAWRTVTGLEDHAVLVSAEQLTALHEELLEVLARYRRVGQGNPAAKRVSVYTCAIPVDGPPRR